MKIVVDLTSLSFHITGIERYALCITKELLLNDKLNEYVLIFRNEIYEEFREFIDEKRVSVYILKGDNKLLFYQCKLLFALYKIRADKYLFFAFASPILFFRKGIYNTIHDMGAWDCPESMKKLQRLYFKISYRIAALISDGIITVSEFSKARISSILGVQTNKILVAPSAVTNKFVSTDCVNYDDVKSRYNLPQKYVMSLSTIEPRKNLELLLEAYVEIMDDVDYDLVLVGRKGWKTDELIEKYRLQTRVCMTGFVEDEDVSNIYKNAICFVFPSKYEGFGLPPLEALALGTPVIASDAASIPEVMMEGAVYFKSDDKTQLVHLLKNVETECLNMCKSLNDYQRENFDFATSAKKIIDEING
jgi:glycosyltransferase involved in cell wall biosynthesis